MSAERSAWSLRALAACAGFACAAPAFAVSTTIANGSLWWTDREGNAHPAGRIGYELWDYDDVSSDDLLQNSFTGLGGQMGLITNEEDGAFDNTLEVYDIIRSVGQFVGNATDTNGNIYTQRVPGPNSYWNVTIGAGTGSEPVGSIGATTFDNDSNLGRLIGVFQAADFDLNYFRNKGLTVPNLTIRYDDTIAGSDCGHGVFNLRYTGWDDWDVVFHELGHHIAENNNLDYREPVTNNATWAGSHSPGRDNIAGAADNGSSYGAVKGTRLAWGEGIATTLGMLAIHDGNLNAAIPNLPAKDRDLSYHSNNLGGDGVTRVTDAQIGIGLSIETTAGGSATTYYRGEGDEWSVSNALWDFYDDTAAENYASPWNVNRNDGVKMGAASLLATMTGADTFRDFWGNLTVTADTAAFKTGALGLPAGANTNQAIAILGEVLEQHAISALPFTQGNVATANPILQFVEQNYGHSDVFRVLIFNADWTLFEMSPNINDTDPAQYSNNLDYTLTSALTLNATYHWIVASTSILDNGGPLNGINAWYWSGANDITYIPAPGAPTLALVASLTLLPIRRRRTRHAPPE